MTQFRTTVAAIVADTRMAPIAAHGIEDVGQEERIAKIVESGNGEEYIVDGTNGKETGQIKEGSTRVEFAPNIINGGKGCDRHGPNEDQEYLQQERLREGIERGIEIERSPLVGCEKLDRGIESGAGGYDEGQERRIERVDVVEMNQFDAATT